MYIKICDRCGQQTNNLPAFLLPTTKDRSSYCVDKQWFGDPITLCDDCLTEFENFRYNHKKFKIQLVEETNE